MSLALEPAGPASGRALRLVPIAVLVALALAPVVAVVGSVLTPTTEVWSHLWSTRLPGMLRSTVLLVALTAAIAVTLGTGLAWLVTAYRFPGSRVLGWLLALPLAVPGYVAGFVWLDTLDYAGPVQTQWRAWFGDDAWFPEVRSLPVAALVLALSLYPYVYLLARAAFREQSAVPFEVARSLGDGRVRAFRRVVLPMARPSIAAGAVLVMMETLTDIGTVRLFNVSTVADGVLRVWFGLGDRGAAAELASLLVVAALLVILLEHRLRGRARFDQKGGHDRGIEPVALRGGRAAAALATAGGVLALAVVVPVVRLGGWALEAFREDRTASPAGGVGWHVRNSLTISLLAVAACVGGALLLTLLARRAGRSARVGAKLATTGYALPGPVVAVGVLVVLAAVDQGGHLPGGVVLVGSVAGLVYALSVRFLAVPFGSVEASLAKITPVMVGSARTLGAGPAAVARRVELPLARAGLLAGTALLAVDALKELPATLLLRPFGVDTLPVWIWNLTSESQWVEASVPALLLVALGLVPLVALLVLLERGRAEVAL